MTPEIAKVTAAHQCSEAEMEFAITRKVLAAFPAGQEGFKPHEKSMSALDLAYHICSAELWFLEAIAAGEFGPVAEKPATIQTFADVVAGYEARFAPELAKVRALDGEALAKIIDMMGAFQLPAATYLDFLIKHTVHHRGQASVYLRLMGAKVPSIYGGSADEAWAGA
jgi:uncharacterized damage-inducible protein DinB